MSANINFNEKTNKHSFVSHKEIPWHRNGTVVEDAMTSAEAIELAGLNYTVDKAKVAAIFPKGVEPSGKYLYNTFATYRTDTYTPFGIVSDRYEIIQNSKAFEFMDSIVGKGKAIYETAGALGKGETVFITAKLPYYITINGEDTIENYLVVSNGHDGSSSLNIFLTPIRVVCANTLAVGLENNKFKIKLRHTTGISDRLDDARQLLNISSSITKNMQEVLTQLSKIKVTDEVAAKYFQSLILSKAELESLAKQEIKLKESAEISTRKKNIINSITDYYYKGIGQSDIIGTAYGAYNAVNGYLSNVKSITGDKKMSSLVLGGTDFKLNNKALDLALTLDN